MISFFSDLLVSVKSIQNQAVTKIYKVLMRTDIHNMSNYYDTIKPTKEELKHRKLFHCEYWSPISHCLCL